MGLGKQAQHNALQKVLSRLMKEYGVPQQRAVALSPFDEFETASAGEPTPQPTVQPLNQILLEIYTKQPCSGDALRNRAGGSNIELSLPLD